MLNTYRVVSTTFRQDGRNPHKHLHLRGTGYLRGIKSKQYPFVCVRENAMITSVACQSLRSGDQRQKCLLPLLCSKCSPAQLAAHLLAASQECLYGHCKQKTSEHVSHLLLTNLIHFAHSDIFCIQACFKAVQSSSLPVNNVWFNPPGRQHFGATTDSPCKVDSLGPERGGGELWGSERPCIPKGSCSFALSCEKTGGAAGRLVSMSSTSSGCGSLPELGSINPERAFPSAHPESGAHSFEVFCIFLLAKSKALTSHRSELEREDLS